MLIASGLDIKKLTERIEAFYETCKKISISKDAVHSLAQVLAFSNMTPDKQMDFVSSIIKGLKENKTAISKSYGLTIIGALAMLGIPVDTLISDITEASNYLNGKDGFKFFNAGKDFRTTYAAISL